MTKFVYWDGGIRRVITMSRAAPEWCNLDCPTIWIESGDLNTCPLRVNSGLILDDVPIGVAALFVRFVAASSEAFYRKYPGLRGTPGRNGFVENLLRQNADLRSRIGGSLWWEKVVDAAKVSV